MINIAEKLKNASKGTKLYSPICGECTLHYIDDNDIVVTKGEHYIYFNHLGQYNIYKESVGECLLFPSKEVKEWDNYQLPAPHDFKPFDKVVGRCDETEWDIDFFSYYSAEDKQRPYHCIGNWHQYCLPYNEETAKLLGTMNKYNG